MKKVLLVLLALSFLAVFLSECDSILEVLEELNAPEEHNAESLVPIEKYDNEITIHPENGDSKGEKEEHPKAITLKDKKCAYNGTDLVILNVENKTEQNYEIAISGTYLAKDGHVLQTETQTFDQLAVNYQHYFLFNPGIVFDKFTYTVEVHATDARMYINDIEFVFSGLQEAYWPIDHLADSGDLTPHPSIQSLFGYKNIGEDKSLGITVEGTVVLFNDSNEIITIYQMRSCVFNTGKTDYATQQIYYTLEEELIWPETFKGEIRPLHATTKVVPK